MYMYMNVSCLFLGDVHSDPLSHSHSLSLFFFLFLSDVRMRFYQKCFVWNWPGKDYVYLKNCAFNGPIMEIGSAVQLQFFAILIQGENRPNWIINLRKKCFLWDKCCFLPKYFAKQVFGCDIINNQFWCVCSHFKSNFVSVTSLMGKYTIIIYVK